MATIELHAYLHGESERYHTCIETAVACAAAGEMCAYACLDVQVMKRMMIPCIRLSQDTTDVYNTAISAMAHGSEIVPKFCRTCAEICDACTEECEKHGMDEYRLCTESSQRCIQERRQVAA